METSIIFTKQMGYSALGNKEQRCSLLTSEFAVLIETLFWQDFIPCIGEKEILTWKQLRLKTKEA